MQGDKSAGGCERSGMRVQGVECRGKRVQGDANAGDESARG